MLTVADVVAVLEDWYPPGSAESWDAVGLSCGDPDEPVEHVLLAVDCVPVTVAEAITGRAQLLLTHHPLFLSGLHAVPATDPKGGLAHQLIRAGVAHYVAHTNADIAVDGVSQALADRLRLIETRPLDPATGPSAVTGTGGGRIGRLAEPLTLADFLDVVGTALPTTVCGVRGAGHPRQLIRTVAVCGGSGGSYADLARSRGADVLVTADLKHHNASEAVAERTRSAGAQDAPMALVDAPHWATEAPWLQVLAAKLRAQFGHRLRVTVSALVTDPWTVHWPLTGTLTA